MIKYYLTLILVGITYGQGADKALDFDGSNAGSSFHMIQT